MELTSKEKGNLTELQCITACYELGYKVSIPYGENSRYDFILDVNGILLKVQVKTCQVSDTGITFSCRSTQANTSGTKYKIYTKEEIDYFATFYNGNCYLVNVEECGSEKTLVFSNKRVNQHNINFIEDYLLENQIQRIINKEPTNLLKKNE